MDWKKILKTVGAVAAAAAATSVGDAMSNGNFRPKEIGGAAAGAAVIAIGALFTNPNTKKKPPVQ